jgi:Spy/CpxP family protein refolding chaperone
MKKTFLTVLIIIISVAASFSQEFGVGGVHRGGTSPVMKQRMKERLKAELKLTDDQVNTISVIQQDYQLKARAVKIDTKTSDDEKNALLKPVEEERRQKLKAILSDEQITKLDEFMKNRRNMRAERQGRKDTN